MFSMSNPQDLPKFQSWLADRWKTELDSVVKILADPMAVHFLISWSIFESSFFVGKDGFPTKIEAFTKSYPAEGRDEQLLQAVRHFHQRYQDRNLYDNLMHTQKCNRLESLIYQREFDDLNAEEQIFLLVWVIYRYRNNIFHGNKGVRSWLRYRKQIGLCVSVMQVMIDAKTDMQNAALIS